MPGFTLRSIRMRRSVFCCFVSRHACRFARWPGTHWPSTCFRLLAHRPRLPAFRFRARLPGPRSPVGAAACTARGVQAASGTSCGGGSLRNLGFPAAFAGKPWGGVCTRSLANLGNFSGCPPAELSSRQQTVAGEFQDNRQAFAANLGTACGTLKAACKRLPVIFSARLQPLAAPAAVPATPCGVPASRCRRRPCLLPPLFCAPRGAEFSVSCGAAEPHMRFSVRSVISDTSSRRRTSDFGSISRDRSGTGRRSFRRITRPRSGLSVAVDCAGAACTEPATPISRKTATPVRTVPVFTSRKGIERTTIRGSSIPIVRWLS